MAQAVAGVAAGLSGTIAGLASLASYPAPFYALTSVQTDSIYACGAQVIANTVSILFAQRMRDFALLRSELGKALARAARA